MGHFIAFEGLDGTGKTTISKQVAAAMNAVYIYSPPTEYQVMRKFIDAEGEPLARFFYYLSANFTLSSRIRKILQANSVVCDRYVYSTIADLYYYRLYSVIEEDKSSELIKLCLDLALKPDLVIYLTCEHEERIIRMQGRNQKKLIETDNLNADYSRVVQNAYSKLAENNWRVIDTTGRDIKACVSIVLETISIL